MCAAQYRQAEHSQGHMDCSVVIMLTKAGGKNPLAGSPLLAVEADPCRAPSV